MESKRGRRSPARPRIELVPNWVKPAEFRYTIAFNDAAWRKVHLPHLEAALAAGEAAIRATLESVTPQPYSVAEVESRGTYADVLWDSDWYVEDEDGADDQEPS